VNRRAAPPTEAGAGGPAPADRRDRLFIDEDGPPPPGYIPGRNLVIAFAAILVVVFGLNLWFALHNRSDAERLERAEQLVDDPARVRHTWRPAPDGLVEEAVSLTGSPQDVALVREWLAKLREERANIGNFGTRAFLHRSLPGRDQLEKLVPVMTIRVDDIADGARLTFTTTDPEAVEQLAVWGRALTEERAARS